MTIANWPKIKNVIFCLNLTTKQIGSDVLISQVSSVTRHKTTCMKVKGPLSRYAYGPNFLKRTFVLFLVVDKRMYLYQPQLQVLAAGYI